MRGGRPSARRWGLGGPRWRAGSPALGPSARSGFAKDSGIWLLGTRLVRGLQLQKVKCLPALGSPSRPRRSSPLLPLRFREAGKGEERYTNKGRGSGGGLPGRSPLLGFPPYFLPSAEGGLLGNGVGEGPFQTKGLVGPVHLLGRKTFPSLWPKTISSPGSPWLRF